MNFNKGHGRFHADADSAFIPLIDVFLNILVFFLVATSFSQVQLFDVVVPSAKSSKASGGSAAKTSIYISKDGAYKLNDVSQDLLELRKYFDSIDTPDRATKQIVVVADENARHGSVVAILDMLRETHYPSVSLVTRAQQ